MHDHEAVRSILDKYRSTTATQGTGCGCPHAPPDRTWTRAAKRALMTHGYEGKIGIEQTANGVAFVSAYGRVPVTAMRAPILLYTLEEARHGAPRKVWDELVRVTTAGFPILWLLAADGSAIGPWTPRVPLTFEHDRPLDVGEVMYAIDYRQPQPAEPPVPGDPRLFNAKLRRVA